MTVLSERRLTAESNAESSSIQAMRPATDHLSRKEAGWLTDVVFVLNSHACVRAFRDYLGLSTQEAAKRVAWAIRILARGAVRNGKKRS